MSEIKNRAVNWMDGMKVSGKHFIQNEDFIYDHVRDSIFYTLTDWNYGLLPVHPPKKSLTAEFLPDTGKSISVKLDECYAITRGGYMIEISPDISRKIFASPVKLELKTENNFVIISVNPYLRSAIGEPALEIPTRHPFTIPNYSIEVVSENDFNSFDASRSTIIGKVQVQNNGDKIVVDKEYIPPSTSLSSNELLLKNYNEKVLKNTENLLERAIELIRILKNPSNPYKVMDPVTLAVTERIIIYLSEIKSSLYGTCISMPPIFVIEKFSSLAFMVDSIIKYMSKDKLPGQPNNINLNDFFKSKYIHHDIRSSINDIDLFCKSLYSIMNLGKVVI